MENFRPEGRGGFGGRSGGSRFGGGRSFRDRGGFGRRDGGRFERRPAEMHNAICDQCKKECQVPFKPSNSKPVYCSDCFRAKENGSRDGGNFNSRPSFSPRSQSGPSQPGISSEQFNKINTKLDKLMEILLNLEIDDGEDLDDDSDDGLVEDMDGDSEDSEEEAKVDPKKVLVEDSEEDLDDDSDEELD